MGHRSRLEGQHRRHHQQVHQRCQIREEGLPGWQLKQVDFHVKFWSFLGGESG